MRDTRSAARAWTKTDAVPKPLGKTVVSEVKDSEVSRFRREWGCDNEGDRCWFGNEDGLQRQTRQDTGMQP